MATARAAATRPRARPKPRARPRPRGGRRPAQGIRWDRVARTMLLVVLLAVLISFLGPATKYVRTWQLARETRSEVRQLKFDNEHLRRQAKLLKDPQQIELRARQLGMAKPGERVYVVRGLPKNR
jgi:cell division protein FtsB